MLTFFVGGVLFISFMGVIMPYKDYIELDLV